MPNFLIQHAYQDLDELSKDRYVNTFHATHLAGAPTTADLAAMEAAILTFFSSEGTTGIKGLIAQHALGPGATIKIYNLADPSPRTPIFANTYTPTVETADWPPLPSEVAICCSYSSPPGDGIPVGRTRNRFYIGPLNTSVLDGAHPTPAHVSTAACLKIRDAFVNMISVASLAGWTIEQYSPTSGLARPIQKIWVDNAFDTQRRRGIKATARSSIAMF